ncbi:zinc metalloprotease [Thermomonospora umbrina]|uniref:zinc metalloprotease n=1 Tax=Thermomonospora umbrina TaxID=111806 RepID=UPI001FE7FA2A|nr:zinc metalloprotease [Thermomonospora umbrina]
MLSASGEPGAPPPSPHTASATGPTAPASAPEPGGTASAPRAASAPYGSAPVGSGPRAASGGGPITPASDARAAAVVAAGVRPDGSCGPDARRRGVHSYDGTDAARALVGGGVLGIWAPPSLEPPRDPSRDPARDRAALRTSQADTLIAALHRALTGRFGTADEAAIDRAERRAAPIVIPVRFHAIADGYAGRLTRATVERQIATLNDAYSGRRGTGAADTGVRFRLAGYEVTSNPAWFRRPDRYERQMKSALHHGGPGTLNLYTAAVGVKVLGFSTYPQSARDRPTEDGVVIDYRSVTGGEYRHYDHGYTAVHEVGHWLGLFHTFENGCDHPGDHVADTPYEAVPTEGCPRSKDTCWDDGADPLHNFMDYAWDACMREFTPGQGRRIRSSWRAFRTASGN